MFDHLQRLNPEGRTYWMELPEIAPGAAIELWHAGESNRPYFNAMLKRAAARARQMGGSRMRIERVNVDMMRQNRQEDRDLFPKHVCTGRWRGIMDQDGEPVECTPETLVEFCEKCPDWIFDRIRNEAADPANFAAEDDEPPPDPQALAGN